MTFDTYKTTDLYEFVKLCQYTNQILRDVKSKFRNINREEYESISKDNLNNQKFNREQSNVSRFRFETSKSNLNNQEQMNRDMNQVSEFENQINAFICYNCDKSDHIARRCSTLKKMNLNNFVREIKKNTSDQDNELRKE